MSKVSTLHPSVVTPRLHAILEAKFGAPALREMNIVKSQRMPVVSDDMNFACSSSMSFLVGEGYLARVRDELARGIR